LDSLRFLSLGDSYTIGEAVEPLDRWPMLLVERLREEGLAVHPPRLVARTGWTTDELREAMESADLSGTFALVTLLIGVNNQYRGLPVAEYRSQFGDLVRRAVELAGQAPGRVLVLSIPDWGVMPFAKGRDRGAIAAEIDLFNRVGREEAEAAGAHWADVTGISREAALAPELVARDGLHPSGRMYARWVEAILPTVRSILATAPQ
jgi:lysophospholipase L1-like esterase